MRKFGVIFDMDGTMLDTERLLAEMWKIAGEAYSYQIPADLLDATIGGTVEHSKALFQEHFGILFPYEKVRGRRIELVNFYIEKRGVPCKLGLFELLSYLKEHQVPIAVATSTPKKIVYDYFHKAGLFSFFSADAILCGDMVAHCKPEPEIYELACSRIEMSPQDCFAVEDSSNGIRAAYRAGLKPIWVPDKLAIENRDKRLCVSCEESLLGVQFYFSRMLEAI